MKLVIFDCDGTLVDSQHMIVEAMNAAFAAAGCPAPDRAIMLRQVGLSVPEAMAAMTDASDDQLVASLSREYRTAYGALRDGGSVSDPLFPGAREALEWLAARDDVLLGIATGKSRRGVDALLRREGFSELFATIQTADDAPSKPHPAMVEQAMDAVGATPENSVMIGDTSFDMAMARAASVTALGVGWGYHTEHDLLDAGAEAVLGDFPALIERLNSNWKTEAA